jgi:hypothetical protein
MQRGDLVTYLARPDWGIGVIDFVTPDTHLVVSFELDGHPYTDEFDSHELEPAKPLVARTA